MKISAFRGVKNSKKAFAQLENQGISLPEREENMMIFMMNKRGIKMDFPSKMREKNSRFGGGIGYFL